MKADKTFAEESATIPEIIHANADSNTGEPRVPSRRPTFDLLRTFNLPLNDYWEDMATVSEDTSGYPDDDFPSDAIIRSDASPVGVGDSLFIPVDPIAIQGRKGPLTDVLADELGVDVAGVLTALSDAEVPQSIH